MTYEEWLKKRQQNQTAGNTGGSSNNKEALATSKKTAESLSYDEWMNARKGNGLENLWQQSGIEAMDRDFWAFAKDERRWLEQGAFSRQYSSNAERWRGNIAQERAWLEKYGARMGDNAQRISNTLDNYEETLNYYDSLYAATAEYEQAGQKVSDYITAGVDPSQIDMAGLLKGKANVSSGATVVLATDQYSKAQEQLMQSFQPFTNGTAMDKDNQAALGKEVSAQKARAKMALTWLEQNKGGLGEEAYAGLKSYYENNLTQLDLMDSTIQWYEDGKSAAVYQDMGNMIQAFQKGEAPTAELAQQEESLYAEVQELQEAVDTWQQQYDDMREALNEGRISEKNLQAAQENLQWSRDNLRGYQQLLVQKEQELQEVQEREAFYWALATNPQTADEDAATVIERGQIRYADEMGAFNRAWNARADEIVAENPDEELAIPRAEAQAKKEARQRYTVAVDSSHMTEEEKKNFYYLLGSGNDQLAIEYANATSVERRRELMAKWTEHASGANVLPATVAYSLLFPLAGADLLSAGYDVNTGLNQSADIGPGGIRDAIVQGAANTLNNEGKLVLPSDIPVLGGKGLGDLYSMALSGAESRGAAMAFGQYATLFLGLSAASSSYNKAVLNGADPEEAKLQAVSSGVFEALFESLSIGQFLDGKVTGSAVKDALIAAGVEASEETMTSIANEIADRMINQDQSQWEQTIAQYRKEGMSREEAEDRAWRELLDTIAWDTVAGGLIGGAMGSGQTVQVYKNADAYIAMQNSENTAEQAMYEAAMIAARVEADDSAEVTRQKVAQWVKEGRKGFGLALKDVVAGRASFEKAAESVEDEKPAQEAQAKAQQPPAVAEPVKAEATAESQYYREPGERFEIPANRRIVDQTEVLRYIAEQNRESIAQMSNQQLAESIDEQMEIRDDESADDQDREMAQMLLDVMFEEQGKRYNNEGGNIRAKVSDEGGQREDGLGAGEQTGAVAEGASRPVAGSQEAQTANRRQSVGRVRQTESTSPEAIGVQGGSRENSLFVVAEEDVAANATLSSIAEDAKGEGANVIFYRGKLRVQNQSGEKSSAVEGIRQVNSNGSVTYYIKADGRIRNAKQIYEHEKFHSIVDGNKGLLLDLVEELDKRYGRQEVARMVLAYVEAYDGIYGTFEESMTADEQEELELRYLNELFADLYAEINRTRVNTAKAREVMAGEKGKIDAERENKKAMRNQNAPPQFSYAGENAKTADLKSLKAAQEMLALNAAMEDIRKATGWHQGKDGKWRFEIDDSGMKYFRGGDAQFQRDHPEYAEYQTLLQKMLFGTITSEEYSRMQEIDSTWGNEYGRLRDRLRSGSGKLVNVIQHDALFAAYPELENVGFQFQELPAGVNGYFDKAKNRIVLSEKLANAPESAILHEIQHVIQIYEGFTPGSSVEYWEAKAQEQGLTAEELYRNTAGEIEARDAAARRKLTAEERKKTSPDYGDENTVFNPKEMDIRYSMDEDVAELDENYYRAMGREDLADELREMRELETELRAEAEEKERIIREAKAEKERMAQEASIQTLKSRIAASEKALNEHKAAKQTLRSIGMYTEEAKEQLENKIANIKETLAIDRAALEQKQKAKRKEEKQKREQKEKEVIQDQKARSSLKQLSTELLGLIHPKEGMRFELRNYIEDLGEKMIRQGALSQEDRTALFTMLYENGEEILEAPEYYADINERLKYGRVYVSEQVRKEFGDDWEAFRKKAWGLRIYLTNDINDLGIDQWTAELADAFGGAFSNDELDLRTQLETLIDTAEEGKAQHLTIGEMMARNRNEYGWSIEEQMDDLERKVDDILFTFAQKAELEIQLRQRSMAQLIKERNRFRQIVAKNQEQKMENTARSNVMKQIQKLSKMRRKASPEYRKMIDETLQGIDTVARRISPRGLEDLQDLAQRYYEAKEKQGENFLRNEYVESRLERLANMQLDNMDIKQVRELGNTVSGIIHSIEYSNKLLTSQHNESIETAAKKIRKEVDESEGSKGGFFRKVKENQLDAKRFFAELGGWSNGAMENFGKRLSAGQNKVMNYQMQASHIFDKFLQDKKNKKWLAKAAGSNAEWVTAEIPADYLAEDGVTRVRFETIELTPMMRVALLMHSKNADNLRHIAGGGMLIPDKKLYKQGKTADAYAKGKKYKLGPAVVKAIVKNCTEQEVEFAKLLSEYFDGLSKEAINETSMTIDGFERAGVWNYYPIISDKNYLAKQNDQVKLDVSIGSLGSIVNERVHAQNPLILEDASKTLMSHIDSISKYYGYAAVLRDLNAVLSHVFHMDNESFSDSVMATIKRKWGSSAEKYIDKIMADLQRPESSSDMLSDFFAKLRGNYAKAVISANPSSVLKQLSSYMVADAYLGEKALLYGMTHPAHTKTLEKYSALYWYRSQGNTTTEIGDVMKKREFGDKVPWIFNATQLMDSFVTKRLLAACEYQIRNETKLVPGTQEEIESGTDRYWMAVAKRFNEVVLNTQSNSTLMERPQLTRASDKSISRFFTMFRTDAFQQFNMLVEAKGRVKYAAKQYKANPSEANLKALKKARKFAARTYGGIIAGQCWVSFVIGLIAFVKGKDDDYRDEEGNWDWGKALVKFGKDMVEGFSGFVVGLDSIYSAVEVAIDNAQGGDAKWYDIEANGFNLLMDGLEQVSKLGNVIKSFNMTEGLGWIRDTAKVLSKAFGIPAENLETYLLSAVRFISPEWSEKYENFWDETTKADLTRESKQTMEAAIGVIMDNRTKGLSDEHKEELARLYQAGGSGAVPSGIPTSVEYTAEDGEKISVELSPGDREEYREVWNEIVSDALPELLAGDDYTKADDERKAELIDKLYKYAGEIAKHSVVPEKEVERWVEQGVTASEDGVSLAEYISFRVSLGDIDGKDKTGEPVDGLKANRSMELLESMGWTDSQERNVYFDVLGTKSDGELTGDGKEMQGLLDAGLSWNDANNVVTMLGKKKDRINAIANLSVSDKTKAAAMMVYGTDKEKKLFDAGVQFGVSFADYNEVIQKADADGSGSVSQEEAETYIRTMGLGWTEMAYLWQMVTDGKDGASNPFGEYWGAEFYNYAHRNDEEK